MILITILPSNTALSTNWLRLRAPIFSEEMIKINESHEYIRYDENTYTGVYQPVPDNSNDEYYNPMVKNYNSIHEGDLL